jgi:hypothetical protein
MSAANPNAMEKSMVSVLVVANAGGGSPLPCGVDAAQEVLDALALSSSPSLPTRMPTDATNPTPMTTAEPDMSPTDAATAAPESTQEWRITTGKAA